MSLILSPDSSIRQEPLIITTELRAKWVADSEQFVRDIFRPPVISSQQRQALRAYDDLVFSRLRRRAYAKDPKHVVPLTPEELAVCQKFGLSLQAGKGVGKNAFEVWVMFHFMDCMPSDAPHQGPALKIMCTGPTEEQLKNNLWAEAYKWMSKSTNGYLMDYYTHTSEKIFRTEFQGKTCFATWKTCTRSADPDDQAATLAGKHEDFMILIADEGSALPDPVFRPIESTMTGVCNFAIVSFNPTRSKGYAIDTQTRDRKHWFAYQWDAEQSEVVDPLHIQRYAEKYGRDSNMYRINIRGLPPKVDSDVLIPFGWAYESIMLELEADDEDVPVAGLDVGGGGANESVLAIGIGGKLLEIHKANLSRKREIAEWADPILGGLGVMAVAVDVNGVGAGVAEHLEDDFDHQVLWVNVGREAERDPDRFERLRDEIWWDLRDGLELGKVQLINDEEMLGQMTSIKYEQYRGSLSKMKVESKREMKARGLKSPDTADAVVLWNYARLKRGRVTRRSHQSLRLSHLRRRLDWRTV